MKRKANAEGKMKIGQLVEVPDWKYIPNGGPYVGNVTQITKNKVRVFFPVHKFVWLFKHSVKAVR